MKVRITRDSEDLHPGLFEGSVLQNVRLDRDRYIGMFCSPYGSYEVAVALDRCELVSDPAIPIPKDAPVEDQEAIWVDVMGIVLVEKGKVALNKLASKYQIIKRKEP